jgi:hypothetical protein
MAALLKGVRFLPVLAILLPAVVSGRFIPFVRPAPAYAWHAQTGDWRLELQRLYVNSNDERDDEPYLAVIGFTSQFGVPGSTRIIWRGLLESLNESTRADSV